MHPLTFVFIGRSGCGKGTQAKLLIEKLKELEPGHPLYYMESGAFFRTFIEGESHASKLSRSIYDAGGLQPEFLAIWVWSNLLIENLRGGEHLVLDGTPRKLREAHVLDSAFSFFGRTKPHIMNIDVSRAWAEERLAARKRSDDTPNDVAARLDWYETDVAPTIEFFAANPAYQFHRVNGEQTIEEVRNDVLAAAGLS